MLCHKLKRKWLLVILFFIFVGKILSHDDMCGDWNMDHASKPPEKQFQCEKKINLQHEISEGSGDDSGLEEDWPWLGTLTSLDDPDSKSIGVVVAPDVVITDLTFKDVEVAKLRFTLKTGFEASVSVLLVKRSPDLLVITLDAPIPNDQFRPVCVPPQGYVSKVIKTNSCQQESSKIVKVNFRDGNIEKSLEPIINEYTCGERIFESEICTERTMSNADNCLKPDEKYLKSKFNTSPTKGTERNSEFYSCHKNSLKAKEKCELDVLEDESRCRDTPATACSVFLKKSDTKNQCVPEINRMAKCIADQFEDSRFPFQGVNCLHDFITMPNCAKHARKAGLKNIGKDWAHDPCKKFKKWKRKQCYKKDQNQYLKKKPYNNNWSLSMVKEVDQFGSDILKETGCASCGVEGNDICTSGNDPAGSDFLFWFDSCRTKWFFLGPSSSTSLECDESLRMHPNIEKGTEYIRNSISSKVPEVELYPRPIIVVLGPTGIGKSTTANALISGHARNSQCFSTGGGIALKTRRLSTRMGKWLGVGSCVTLVDTPGTDDTSGPHQDFGNIKELMNTLKYDLKNIDVFLVMFKENNLRFVESMRKALDLFVSIFGDTFWDNVVTEFTYAGFSVEEIRQRYERVCTECKKITSYGYNDDIWDYDGGSCSGDQADDDNNDNLNFGSGSGSGCGDGNDGQQEDITKCSILAADAVKGSDFFKVGSLENEDWKILDKDSDYVSNQQSYLRTCGWYANNDVYDKADYATRKIKEMDWNAVYSSHFRVLENNTIPTVFIHPVYDKNDLRQCQAFKRETSKLWNLIGSMKPFQCSDKCEVSLKIKIDSSWAQWGEWSTCSQTCTGRQGHHGSKSRSRECIPAENSEVTCDKLDVKDGIDSSPCGTENRRCPVFFEGEWGPWSEYSACSAACGGGHQQRERSCDYKMIEIFGMIEKDGFDEDYDTKMPCSGDGVENTGDNSCNNHVCVISTLIFLMDTSGSFSGVDTNSAFTLARGLLKGLDDDAIIVPKYQLVEVNDPTVTKRNTVTNRKTFENQLFGLYRKSHPGGGDWAERSFKALAKPYALSIAPYRSIICLFTDAGSHDLDKQAEIIKLRDEKDIQIFVFLTPDYNIYGGYQEESYRAYQAISKRHTYIMSETHPDTILNLVKKYVKKVDEDCQTLGGPPRWGDYPSECQFPFTYKNITYETCTSVDHNQPWCSTVTGAKNEYLEGKWGNCGDCSGKVNPLCTSYTTLSDPWRKVSDMRHSSKMDDSTLARGWYRFNVTGAGKIPTSPPTGSANGVDNDICGTGGVAWMTGDLPTHTQKVVERKFCFESDTECNHFKRLNVLWCTDGVNPEFYIYELKPTLRDFGYCVIE